MRSVQTRLKQLEAANPRAFRAGVMCRQEVDATGRRVTGYRFIYDDEGEFVSRCDAESLEDLKARVKAGVPDDVLLVMLDFIGADNGRPSGYPV